MLTYKNLINVSLEPERMTINEPLNSLVNKLVKLIVTYNAHYIILSSDFILHI